MNKKFEKLGFYPADILLPKDQDMTKWAVVACDQFTSEPEYWQAVEQTVGDAPSTLRLILPALDGLLSPEGEAVCLVKPQFEAGKDKVGKKGVVRDPQVHLEVLEQFLVHAANAGFSVKDITFSPIKGPEGNIEYLGYLTTREVPPYTGDLAALVEQSHSAWKEAEG